tara:strand:+ start:1160 stop:1321 length:162 start_codon:yes stop_codon:yes gene_type:complete
MEDDKLNIVAEAFIAVYNFAWTELTKEQQQKLLPALNKLKHGVEDALDEARIS